MSDKNNKLIDYGRLKRFHTNLKNNDLSKLQGKLTAGANITISDNTISATGGVEYTAGNNIQINGNNQISCTYQLPTASTSTLGGVKVGSGLKMTGEVLSADVTPEILFKLISNQDLLNPLTFEAATNNTSIYYLSSNHNKIEISKDGKTWEEVTGPDNSGILLATLNNGEHLYVRGANVSYAGDRFTFSENTYVYGNIMSLINKFNYPLIYNVNNYAFESLFLNNNKLLSHQSKKLLLPATTLGDGCYSNMFEGCSSLTTAPELPATVLKKHCYSGMFEGCTSLTTAPELLALSLLVEWCYLNMFKGCSSLNYIKCMATATNVEQTEDWLSGVAATGTFVTPQSTNWATGSSGIPSGWTRVNA